MALGDTKEFVQVVLADQVTGAANVVKFYVGDDISGTDPVAIVGGNYRQTDPWVISLKTKISSRRQF